MEIIAVYKQECEKAMPGPLFYDNISLQYVNRLGNLRPNTGVND